MGYFLIDGVSDGVSEGKIKLLRAAESGIMTVLAVFIVYVVVFTGLAEKEAI